jgi:hypothetical protein
MNEDKVSRGTLNRAPGLLFDHRGKMMGGATIMDALRGKYGAEMKAWLSEKPSSTLVYYGSIEIWIDPEDTHFVRVLNRVGLVDTDKLIEVKPETIEALREMWKSGRKGWTCFRRGRLVVFRREPKVSLA